MDSSAVARSSTAIKARARCPRETLAAQLDLLRLELAGGLARAGASLAGVVARHVVPERERGEALALGAVRGPGEHQQVVALEGPSSCPGLIQSVQAHERTRRERRGSPSSASIRLAASTWNRVDRPLVSVSASPSHAVVEFVEGDEDAEVPLGRGGLAARPSFSMSQNSPG